MLYMLRVVAQKPREVRYYGPFHNARVAMDWAKSAFCCLPQRWQTHHPDKNESMVASYVGPTSFAAAHVSVVQVMPTFMFDQ